MAFWARVEEHLLALQKDRGRMARLFLIAYWISTAFVTVGLVLIILFIWHGGLK